MNSSHDSRHNFEETGMIDDLALDNEAIEANHAAVERAAAPSSPARGNRTARLPGLPGSLTAIGRDIGRTIERAISPKDEHMPGIKVSPMAQEKLDQLVQAGVFRNQADAAAYLVDEGIKSQSALFERVDQKLAEIERLHAELRGLVDERQV